MAAKFEILDYCIFGLTILMSVCISLYFACSGNKQKHAKVYLYGSGNLSSIPIGLSLLSSALSALLFVGVIQEVYIFGVAYITSILGCLLGLLVTWNFILPVFCGNLNLKAPYEYFERRFNSKIRVLLSALYCFHVAIYNGVILYASTISFSEASGIELYICTTVIGAICTIYTLLGGFQGVIWTDVLQTVLMVSSTIFIVFKGVVASGGFVNVLYEAQKGQRLNLFNFDPNPLVRISIWSTTLGFCVLNVAHCSCAASGIQRYMAIRTEKEARVSASIFSYGFSIIKALCAIIGLCIYVYYKDCDPINAKKISNGTHLLAYYINDIFEGTNKGFLGLFTAGLLSAGLSSVSAELNAVSGLFYYDILRNIFTFPDNELRATVIMKLVVLVYGIIMIIEAPLIQYFNYVSKMSLTFSAWTYGVKFGVMTLSICFPKANSWGVFIGILCGFTTTAWISIKANIYKVSRQFVLPRSIENCTDLNISTTTFSNLTTSQIPMQSHRDYPWIYGISYMYYPVLGAIITIVVGIVVSYITGVNDVNNIDTRLIIPCVRPTEENGRKRFRNIFKRKRKPSVDNNEMQSS